jgi:hypothetical protein
MPYLQTKIGGINGKIVKAYRNKFGRYTVKGMPVDIGIRIAYRDYSSE